MRNNQTRQSVDTSSLNAAKGIVVAMVASLALWLLIGLWIAS